MTNVSVSRHIGFLPPTHRTSRKFDNGSDKFLHRFFQTTAIILTATLLILSHLTQIGVRCVSYSWDNTFVCNNVIFSAWWRHYRYDVIRACRGSDWGNIVFFIMWDRWLRKKTVLNFHHLVCYGRPLWWCTTRLTDAHRGLIVEMRAVSQSVVRWPGHQDDYRLVTGGAKVL